MPYTAATCPGCKRRMVEAAVSRRTPAPPAPADFNETTLNLPYRRCYDCRFWIGKDERYCPNCGLIRPEERQPPDDYLTSVAKYPRNHGCFIATMTLVVLFGTEIILLSVTGARIDGGLLVLLMLVLTPTIIIGGFKLLKRLAVTPPAVEQYSSRNLRQSEGTIGQRLKEIKERRERISSVLARAKGGAGEQWEGVRKTLAGALETLDRHRVQYALKQVEVEAVRWQNSLTPLHYGWEALTYESAERRLKALDDASRTGTDLKSRLEGERKAAGTLPELEELSRRVDETLESCRKMHDGLVARQAVLALKGVSPLGDAASAPPAPVAGRREMEVFNIQTAITDFSSSFTELEAEYARLRAEDEVAEEMNRITGNVYGG